MADTIPHKIEIREGEAYIRYQGITYAIQLEYFKLEATRRYLSEASPTLKTIECKGFVSEK